MSNIVTNHKLYSLITQVVEVPSSAISLTLKLTTEESLISYTDQAMQTHTIHLTRGQAHDLYTILNDVFQLPNHLLIQALSLQLDINLLPKVTIDFHIDPTIEANPS
jgi:hypothetical protein